MVFWFDLELDSEVKLSTAPDNTRSAAVDPEEEGADAFGGNAGVCHVVEVMWFSHMGPSPFVDTDVGIRHSTCWKQAIQFLPEPIQVKKGSRLTLWVQHDQTRIAFLDAPPPPDSD